VTDEEIAEIDAALRNWRQGDVALTEALPAIHLADLSVPGTPASAQLAQRTANTDEPARLAVVAEHFDGFMVVSQTCDIVRSVAHRPFVEVCPLIKIPAENLRQMRAGRMPRYLSCSALGDRELAADLERVTTVEKRTLIQFNTDRLRGVASDDERRRIASALGRKRARAALPDEFVRFVDPLQRRVKERHGRKSAEGRFLEATREIRVVAQPSWDAERIEVTLLFLFNRQDEIPLDAERQVQALVERVEAHERYSLEGQVRALDQISGAAYVESDPLDLDALSDG
jgi:hypothetical protein